MKLFALRVGSTKVPYGQFYGGLDGWRGLGALYRYATDKRHFIEVPIHAYLIEHPTAGPILVDTGINRRQAQQHRQYYRGLPRLLFDDDEYQLDPAEELPAALAGHGRDVDDITTVVATHLHEDHIGGLAELPRAELVVSRTEWEQRHHRLFGFVPTVYQPSLPATDRARLIDFADGPFESFPETHRLTPDGTVLLLPTPGHSPGHLCVLVTFDDHLVLLTGDCLYTLRHLAVDDIQAFGTGRFVAQQNASIRQICELKRRRPDLVIVPTHDHTAYQHELLVPGLATGRLSPDARRAIATHEASLFTTDGRLRTDAFPRYCPPADGSRVGTVGLAAAVHGGPLAATDPDR